MKIYIREREIEIIVVIIFKFDACQGHSLNNDFLCYLNVQDLILMCRLLHRKFKNKVIYIFSVKMGVTQVVIV